MLHILEHSLLDTARLLPFLYVTYLLMELLEHKFSDRSAAMIRRAGRFGPLVGGLLGAVPQCGFSAAAAGLYAGGVLSVGTLLSVFLSTSDEMLPILISYQAPLGLVLKLLGLKAAIGAAVGFAVDGLLRRKPAGETSVHDLCQHDHCRCGSGRLFLAALRHTASIALFLLVFTVLLNGVLLLAGEDVLARILQGNPVLAVVLAALVGLVPNCAASVAITTLYLDGLLPFGAMLAGLLVSTGVGLLMLLRIHRDWKDNLRITAILLAVGVACGGICDLLHWSL